MVRRFERHRQSGTGSLPPLPAELGWLAAGQRRLI
jgi:hypothetical protein